MMHNYNFENSRLQEQNYTIYRDLRCWTGALTFRIVDNGYGPTDYTVAFTFSLKAAPRLTWRRRHSPLSARRGVKFKLNLPGLADHRLTPQQTPAATG